MIVDLETRAGSKTGVLEEREQRVADFEKIKNLVKWLGMEEHGQRMRAEKDAAKLKTREVPKGSLCSN